MPASPNRHLVLSLVGLVVVAAAALSLFVWTPSAGAEPQTALTLYSGRSRALVQPIIRQFSRETGIPVDVRYGETAQLAIALAEEGRQSPADVFWAQDAGGLGAVVKRDLLQELPSTLLERVEPAYRNPEGYWVATSGRARVLAYSSVRVKPHELPQSVFDLTDARFRGRVGWAPTNASFQSFVTAMRRTHGDERTLQWLQAMKVNGVRAYAKNSAIIQGIAAGEVDFGLPNHYYLLNFKKSDRNYPVEQTHFATGDIGNMVNVAGVGIVRTTDQSDAAQKLVEYLLSAKAQQFFASETFEYPVTDEVIASDRLEDLSALQAGAPQVDLDSLEDLEGTLALLRQAGLL